MSLDLTDTSVVEEGAPRPSRNHHHRPKRQVMLYVHLSRAAVEGIGTARLEQGNQLITAGQVRDWCGTAGNVIVKPVLDLEAHDPVDSPTSCPSGTPRPPRSGTGPASSPGAPAPPAAATPTTPSRTAAADPPARATSRSCADDTTGSRPTATGPTPSSNPGCISGPRSTGTSTSATPTAPSTSAPTDVVSRQALRAFLNHRSNYPARARGHRHAHPADTGPGQPRWPKGQISRRRPRPRRTPRDPPA